MQKIDNKQNKNKWDNYNFFYKKSCISFDKDVNLVRKKYLNHIYYYSKIY
jgi:hypothetical protein